MVKVARTFKFCASHRLTKHKGLCRNIHGHTYAVDLVIEDKINSHTGMVMDFAEMRILEEEVKHYFDHAILLNKYDEELVKFCEEQDYRIVYLKDDPTAELIAGSILETARMIFPEVNSIFIRVHESEKTWAEVCYVKGE